MKKIKSSRLIKIFVCAVFFLSAAPAPYIFAQIRQQEVMPLLQEAERMIREGNYYEAELNCERVLRINSEIFPAHNLLGAIALMKEDRYGAIYHFEKSLEIQPEQAYIYNRLSELHRQTGEEEKGIGYLKKGIELFPEDFNLNHNLAVYYLTEENDPEKALTYFKKAESHGDANPNFHFLMGLSYVFAGQKINALEQITMLRQAKEELLARRLESVIRQWEEGDDLSPRKEIPDDQVPDFDAPPEELRRRPDGPSPPSRGASPFPEAPDRDRSRMPARPPQPGERPARR